MALWIAILQILKCVYLLRMSCARGTSAVLPNFQIVSLSNLRPSSVGMAQALIPSLSELPEDDVQTVLQALSQAAVSLLS
jgi:hypothetical protein